ncbi:MAG: hypothetical protein ABFD12_12390 [Syntrophorhabdus sp.]
MKYLAMALFAIILVIPTLSDAGNASSRYDITFGGFVKYDLGYSTQNMHADPTVADRQSGSFEWLADKYGNTFQTAGETRFNFLIRGPALENAKTSAFIEGDFRGVTTGNSYGGFQLRHAFMSLNWQSAELMLGQNWQQWGMPYYNAALGNNDFGQYLGGIRTPQATFRYFFTKTFNAMIGVTSATEWSGSDDIRQFDDGYARSGWPGIIGEIAYSADRCGKVGPDNLKFALGAYYGKEKKIWPPIGTAREYRDTDLNAWITAFRFSIPFVPEKPGNKKMSLLLNGNFFYGQNVSGNSWMMPGGPSNGSYWRNIRTNEAAAPVVFGTFAQLSWWLTDTLWVNGMFGYLKYKYSSILRDFLPDNVNMMQTYGVNLLWDVNESMRFGIQWMTMFTGYNRAWLYPALGFKDTGDRTGQIDQYRIAAWYFF